MNNRPFFKQLESSLSHFKDKQTVLVGGCFDVIHLGHVEFLRFAKSQGEFLIVALESDEFIKKHKKRTPVHTALERKKILESIRYVDHVILLPLFESHEDYFQLVKTIEPTIIAVTEGDRQLENKTAQAKLIGGEVRICPHVIGFSTSHIISGKMVASQEV